MSTPKNHKNTPLPQIEVIKAIRASNAKQEDPVNVLRASEIRAAKGTVLDMEKANYTHLILWQSTGGWWKMCQHSALIYAHKIAPDVLGKTKPVELRADTDHYFFASSGITSIAKIDRFTEELKNHNIKLSSTSTKTIKIFNLPKALHFTEEDLSNFLLVERGRYDRLNVMFRVQNIYPALNAEIRKAVPAVYQITKDMSLTRRDFIGRRLNDAVIDLHSAYLDIEHGKAEPAAGLLQVYNITDSLLGLFHLVAESRLASLTNLEKTVRHLYNILTTAIGELRKLDIDPTGSK